MSPQPGRAHAQRATEPTDGSVVGTAVLRATHVIDERPVAATSGGSGATAQCIVPMDANTRREAAYPAIDATTALQPSTPTSTQLPITLRITTGGVLDASVDASIDAASPADCPSASGSLEPCVDQGIECASDYAVPGLNPLACTTRSRCDWICDL